MIFSEARKIVAVVARSRMSVHFTLSRVRRCRVENVRVVWTSACASCAHAVHPARRATVVCIDSGQRIRQPVYSHSQLPTQWTRSAPSSLSLHTHSFPRSAPSSLSVLIHSFPRSAASSLSVSATNMLIPSAIFVVAHTSALSANRNSASERLPPPTMESAHAALAAAGASCRGSGCCAAASWSRIDGGIVTSNGDWG